MQMVCQQMILMKYYALFVVFEKVAKFAIVVCKICNCRLLQIMGGALTVKF